MDEPRPGSQRQFEGILKFNWGQLNHNLELPRKRDSMASPPQEAYECGEVIGTRTTFDRAQPPESFNHRDLLPYASEVTLSSKQNKRRRGGRMEMDSRRPKEKAKKLEQNILTSSESNVLASR
ncbi:hypothetical protein HYALB_00004960 [Hymenoscyphus albidus]|uniref:Uncharacterized protein n=1 Tax=Hymenoscyphus albidus TaxID=595503 RepID=A0A9N9LRY0_9HELO|nr:hypothetical protein HYALB_00004960 [Hymenoscyphus albidus]